jgi:DNA-binding NtrC family response regulator
MPPELARIPVIVLSGARDARAAGQALGAAAIVMKPFDLDALVTLVRQVLDQPNAPTRERRARA